MNLVEEKQIGLIPSGLQSWQLKLIEHLTNTTSVAPPPSETSETPGSNQKGALGSLVYNVFFCFCHFLIWCPGSGMVCYDIMPVRKEEGKSYWKIPFCDDDATREK